MKNITLLSLLCFVIFACNNEIKSTMNKKVELTYPETKKDDSVVDNYHGNEVKDPYRWLEIDTASDVKSWVTEQNEVTFDYLSKIPYRDAIKDRYEELFNYEKLGSPFKVGEHYFFSKNDGLQNQIKSIKFFHC